MGNNNAQNTGNDLALIGAWLTVLADLMAAVGATIVTGPDSNTAKMICKIN